MSQMTLWNAESLGIVENLRNVTVVRQSHNKETKELTAESLRLLPMTSKDGPSLKSVTGLAGVALKSKARECLDQLKQVAVHQAVAIGGNSQFTFRSMRFTKTGNVSMSFKRVAALRLEDYTAEELQARLDALKAAEQPTIENGKTEPEPKAKGNGNGKAKRSKKTASPAPAPAAK